ncbi:endonuclease, partial [Bacteroides xylanisolvens]
IKSAQIVGPTGSIVRGQRIEEQTKDPIIPPVNNQWPSDHKGVLITFYIKE